MTRAESQLLALLAQLDERLDTLDEKHARLLTVVMDEATWQRLMHLICHVVGAYDDDDFENLGHYINLLRDVLERHSDTPAAKVN